MAKPLMTVEVKGLKELQSALLELPRKLDRPVLNSALRTGARPMAAAARSRAPMDTGALRAAIVVRAVRSREHSAEVHVGVTGARQVQKTDKKGRVRNVWKRTKNFLHYWLYHEFGTSKMPARPFLRPAFESNKAASAELIKTGLRDRIEKEATKLGRK